GGTSGHTFTNQIDTKTSSVVLTSPTALAQYTGTGSVSVTGDMTATSGVTGGGNLAASIDSEGDGQVVIIYHYLPSNALKPGTYTIVELSPPDGYTRGWTTSGNVAPTANSLGSDRINVTLGNSNLTNNNFGALGGCLSGTVYLDANWNGIRDTGENALAG